MPHDIRCNLPNRIDSLRAKINADKANAANAKRYLHLKATWNSGLLERLDNNVLPQHWDAAIDKDIANLTTKVDT